MIKSELSIRQRILAISIYILMLVFINGFVTGVWLPAEGGKSLWFYSAIGLYFFTHLSSPFFVAPRDSLANSSTSALLLATTDLTAVSKFGQALDTFRWVSFSIAVLAAISALTAVLMHRTDPADKPRRALLSRTTYRLSDSLGRGQIMFAPLVLISILGFYQGDPVQQMWLLFILAGLIFLEPVDLFIKIVNDLAEMRSQPFRRRVIGEIERIDDPNIIRVRLISVETWKRENIHLAHLPDSRQVEVIPLFLQLQEARPIGTGLCHTEPPQRIKNTAVGNVYHCGDLRSADQVLMELCGDDPPSELIGFVVEGSEIGQIRFEVSSGVHLEEGWLVFVRQGDPVYYQILNAQTKEESFNQNPRGIQVVLARQLGRLDVNKGFVRYGWVPIMNSPVFLLMVRSNCDKL